MKGAIVFEAERTGYGIDQIEDKAMTVGELKELLEDYNDDDLFILSHDRGYTYGSISYPTIWEREDGGEWYEC